MSLHLANNNIAYATGASRHAEAMEIKGLADHLEMDVSKVGVTWLYIPEIKRELARLYINRSCKRVV